ncbi:hypothetical protein [Candidatus Nitrosocosmicus hydrocola]|uniref:hypothetical protein n=1 Tax=Candidatus Nitrosocosmicus hydrocola TaxID=1826872 RepID=UPI000A951C6C|nr:hypothetical protein [Candidatus Nitrosocosmicus hydrocola]
MNFNIRNLAMMVAAFALVVGVAAMAPATQSAQADWLDVEDFGCVGVNNCNPETCTDSSVSEVGTEQSTSADRGGTSSSTSGTALGIAAPFTCLAGEAEVEDSGLGTVPTTP